MLAGESIKNRQFITLFSRGFIAIICVTFHKSIFFLSVQCFLSGNEQNCLKMRRFEKHEEG